MKLPWHSPRCTGTGHCGGTRYGDFLACPLAYNTAEVKHTLIVFEPVLRAPLILKIYLWNMFFDLPTWMPFTRIVATVSSPSKTRRICLFDVISLETVGKYKVIIYYMIITIPTLCRTKMIKLTWGSDSSQVDLGTGVRISSSVAGSSEDVSKGGGKEGYTLLHVIGLISNM